MVLMVCWLPQACCSGAELSLFMLSMMAPHAPQPIHLPHHHHSHQH